jgi:hypothetical protein
MRNLKYETGKSQFVNCDDPLHNLMSSRERKNKKKRFYETKLDPKLSFLHKKVFGELLSTELNTGKM